MIMINDDMIINVKRSESLAMTGRGRGGVDREFRGHDMEVGGDGFMADVLLWKTVEACGCGNGVVLCVPAPSNVSLLFSPYHCESYLVRFSQMFLQLLNALFFLFNCSCWYNYLAIDAWTNGDEAEARARAGACAGFRSRVVLGAGS
jgi:hypothetical protein